GPRRDALDLRTGAKKNPGPEQKTRRGLGREARGRVPHREGRRVGRLRRENPDQYSRRHRAATDVRRETFAGRRVARRRTVAGKFALASRRNPLQRGGEFAAVEGSHWRHRPAGLVEEAD